MRRDRVGDSLSRRIRAPITPRPLENSLPASALESHLQINHFTGPRGGWCVNRLWIPCSPGSRPSSIMEIEGTNVMAASKSSRANRKYKT